MEEMQNALENRGLLHASRIAQKARESGDRGKAWFLINHVSKIAEMRNAKLDQIPHDSTKCPHSH